MFMLAVYVDYSGCFSVIFMFYCSCVHSVYFLLVCMFMTAQLGTLACVYICVVWCLNILNECVLNFCICICSAQMSMIYMEKCYKRIRHHHYYHYCCYYCISSLQTLHHFQCDCVFFL